MSSLSKKIYISMNHVNFLSFDNDDMKPSKRQFTLLSLISGLNHNINILQNWVRPLLTKPIKGPLHRRGRLWSQPSFTELSLKFSNYELRTLFNEAKCDLELPPGHGNQKNKKENFPSQKANVVVTSMNIHDQNYLFKGNFFLKKKS